MREITAYTIFGCVFVVAVMITITISNDKNKEAEKVLYASLKDKNMTANEMALVIATAQGDKFALNILKEKK